MVETDRGWRNVDCLKFEQKGKIIKPQHTRSRGLRALTQGSRPLFTTEVRPAPDWAAHISDFERPKPLDDTCGLAPMGLRLSCLHRSVQMPHPPTAGNQNVAGEARELDEHAEMGTAMQLRPDRFQTVFIRTMNVWGMVPPVQELLGMASVIPKAGLNPCRLC